MNCENCLWRDTCSADGICEHYYDDNFIDTYIETSKREYREAWDTYLTEFYEA